MQCRQPRSQTKDITNFFHFFFSSRRRHTSFDCDWSSDVCSSDLPRDVLPGPDAPPALLHQAIHYSVFAGGKRIRPILALAACDTVGGDVDRVLPLIVALELIHTYSLIHDDLPAMDDDDVRRGQPTNHRMFGEDLAILAGDALQALAFGLLSDPTRGRGRPAEARLAAGSELAAAAGGGGPGGGHGVGLGG